MSQRHTILIVSVICYALFVLNTHSGKPAARTQTGTEGEVVISAPVQLMMFAGDNYLAANLEAIRSATITLDNAGDKDRAAYRLRSHLVVSRLNPCHEDNYYLSNAVLTWDGMVNAGNRILKRASDCRFWDEYPPFFYGFNEYFFNRNTKLAYEALLDAAARATNNAAALRKLAIMIKAESMDDVEMAIRYLQQEKARSADTKLKHMLERRIIRLQGLKILRNAQHEYEKVREKKLHDPKQLIDAGIIEAYPHDPLGLGYIFIDNEFKLAQRKIQGLESAQ